MTEVTQADREAAAELAHALGISCEDFTSGAADVLVQAFARHRIAEREKIVAWLRSLQRSLHLTHRYAVAAGFFANAIEAGEHDHD